MSPLTAKLFKPFTKFLQLQASSSFLLLLATVAALIWANGWPSEYHHFWHTPITLGFGELIFRESLHFWINDAMMAIFFLVVGLEIKRELLVGELSSPKQAALPIAAAIGGMIVPALAYLVFHPPGSPYNRGWGIPMVTDIAFAIGVLTVLGNRVPLGLKVFLTALAIVDDLGAILLIALFYSGGVHLPAFGAALVIFGFLWILNRLGVDRTWPYLPTGLLLWLAVLQSGLHATLAGVLLAFTIPARGKIDPQAFYQESQDILERFRKAGTPADRRIILTNQEHQASVQDLENLCEEVQSPLQVLEHNLHPWISHLVLPLFAIANAGVAIDFSQLGEALSRPITLAVVTGLFLGKQVGITLFSWLAVRLGWAALPQGIRWPAVYGTSILGGIGFTMSLFVSVLAFPNPELVNDAKLGILIASLLSGAVGLLVLHFMLRSRPAESEPES